ncbi:Serpin B9, partial [Trichinella sp. T6]
LGEEQEAENNRFCEEGIFRILWYKAKQKMYFLSKSSTAIGTITQGPDVPIPLPPDSIDTIVLSDEESSEETISESDFETEHKNTPQLFTQCELNDLVLDQDCGIVVNEMEAEIAKPLADFAYSLYQLEEAGNVFFSPVSIFLALAMVFFGSNGNTNTQLLNVMFKAGWKKNHTKMAMQSLVSSLTIDEYYDASLKLANRLYADVHYPILPSFLEDVKKYLSSDLVSVNFGDTEAARLQINNWVSNQTNHKINDLLQSGTVEANTCLIAVNAIYFKASWDNVFDEKYTKPRKFYTTPHSSIEIPMMTHTDGYSYYETKDYQLLGMDYYPDYLKMFVLLPKSGKTLAELQQKFNGESLLSLVSKVRGVEVEVTIPKMKFDQQMNLVEALKKLGIKDLFSPEKADLSGISVKEKLHVSDIAHKAYLEFNEEGTEAAAATAVRIVPMSGVMYEKSFEFVADHPFLFFIFDSRSKAILFIGRFSGN